MKMIIGIFGGIVVIFVLFLAWAGWPWSLEGHEVKVEVVHVEPKEMVDTEESPSVIKVLTWNTSFLYGDGSEGVGYSFREKKLYEEALDKMVAKIKEWRPDVVFLQEIDFESARSGYINQAQYLAEKAGFPYVAEAVSWEANYTPFPYWPIVNNFGRMRSGGAILSRYPLIDHMVTLLPKPQSNPWWYNIFYLHRYFQLVTLDLGSKKFKLVNLHLEAFDAKDRQSQIKSLSKFIKDHQVDIAAGDFNMLHASATKKGKFKNGDNYENDESYALMMKSGLLEVVPEGIYSLSESSYFTFPASKPDRRLDYIFYNAALKMMKAEVLPSGLGGVPLSDHLPIRASFQVGSPKVNPYSL
jgi:endonuclease/exonuclease/phosphatase family metal-dependent hydrolase